MKYKDEFGTDSEVIAYDKWVNINLEGEFDGDILEGITPVASISIDLPKDKAVEMAKEILKHFDEFPV